MDFSVSYVLSPIPMREYMHDAMRINLDWVKRCSYAEFKSIVMAEAHRVFSDKLLLAIWMYPIHNEIDKDVTVVFSYT